MRSAVTMFVALMLGGAALASPQDLAGPDGAIKGEDLEQERVYSPYSGRAYADQVFFGDMHFHTNLSFDAGLVGTSLDVHDGFRVARGEKVISNSGQPVQLIRPLDFLVITDHSEMIWPRRSTSRTRSCWPTPDALDGTWTAPPVRRVE